MRRFKFKEWVFKNLFPYYFQENDTYIDSSGKGILQRFTEVCSEYFDTDILEDQGTQPGLDNIVNLIDVDLTPDLFLNYLWEFLGEIPYAYGLIIQGKTYDKDNLRDWIFNNTDFPQADPRKLLKYAISLYKIRGTDKFYTILGRFYGFQIELIEVTDGGDPGDDILVPSHDHLVLATYNPGDYTADIQLNKYVTDVGEIRPANGWALKTDIVLVPNKELRFKENHLRYHMYIITCYDSNDTFLGNKYLARANWYNLPVDTILSYYPTTHHIHLDIWGGSNHPALTQEDVNDWDLKQTDGNDDSIATYALGTNEIRAPYPDGDCYSCLYFLVKVGMSVERYNQLVSSGRLNTVITLLLSIIEKYLPIHCKMAHYTNGDPKVVLRTLGDFNDDYNADFENTDTII